MGTYECGLGKKKQKKTVVLESSQWTHSEGKGHDLPPNGKYSALELKYCAYNISIFPPKHFWLSC